MVSCRAFANSRISITESTATAGAIGVAPLVLPCVPPGLRRRALVAAVWRREDDDDDLPFFVAGAAVEMIASACRGDVPDRFPSYHQTLSGKGAREKTSKE
jgi:hypothetical protein